MSTKCGALAIHTSGRGLAASFLSSGGTFGALRPDPVTSEVGNTLA